MNDFKYAVGQKVKTKFNGYFQDAVITGRHKARSETGNLYDTYPILGTGNGLDENWFQESNETQTELF